MARRHKLTYKTLSKILHSHLDTTNYSMWREVYTFSNANGVKQCGCMYIRLRNLVSEPSKRMLDALEAEYTNLIVNWPFSIYLLDKSIDWGHEIGRET